MWISLASKMQRRWRATTATIKLRERRFNVWRGIWMESCSNGPEPAWPKKITSRLGQNQPGPEKKKKQTGEGELFSPFHPPACRTKYRSACRRKWSRRRKKKMKGKKSYLARRRWCLAGLTASLAVLRWRSVAVLWLKDDISKQWCCCFKRRRERFLLFPSSLVFHFFFLFFCCQMVSPFSILCLFFS